MFLDNGSDLDLIEFDFVRFRTWLGLDSFNYT